MENGPVEISWLWSIQHGDSNQELCEDLPKGNWDHGLWRIYVYVDYPVYKPWLICVNPRICLPHSWFMNHDWYVDPIVDWCSPVFLVYTSIHFNEALGGKAPCIPHEAAVKCRKKWMVSDPAIFVGKNWYNKMERSTSFRLEDEVFPCIFSVFRWENSRKFESVLPKGMVDVRWRAYFHGICSWESQEITLHGPSLG